MACLMAMLLEASLGCSEGAGQVRDAVSAVLAEGHRTGDLVLAGDARPTVGCTQMGDLVVAKLGEA